MNQPRNWDSFKEPLITLKVMEYTIVYINFEKHDSYSAITIAIRKQAYDYFTSLTFT